MSTRLTQSMVDPALFRAAKRQAIAAVAVDAQTVRVTDERFEGERLRTVDGPLDYEVGEAVEVSADAHWFVCSSAAERERERREKRAKAHLRDRERRQRRADRRAEAEEFWAQYALPFEFDVGIKGRLSGLSEGSWGDGRAQNTVEHLFVREAVADGRLERDADSFLCAPGASWPFEEVRRSDAEGDMYLPPVTCKTCLERMARWRFEAAEEA